MKPTVVYTKRASGPQKPQVKSKATIDSEDESEDDQASSKSSSSDSDVEKGSFTSAKDKKKRKDHPTSPGKLVELDKKKPKKEVTSVSPAESKDVKPKLSRRARNADEGESDENVAIPASRESPHTRIAGSQLATTFSIGQSTGVETISRTGGI
jgi:hypothetical protein